jgi:hypothetical protein
VAIPNLTKTFVSSNNGFSFKYADDSTIQPSKVLAIQGVEQNNDEFDFILDDPFGAFRGSSIAVPDGVSIDQWVDQYVGYQPGGCSVPRGDQLEMTIDGQPGRVWDQGPGEIEATVVAGGRLYVFTLFAETGVSRPVFDAYAATIHLRPEDARKPSSTPLASSTPQPPNPSQS